MSSADLIDWHKIENAQRSLLPGGHPEHEGAQAAHRRSRFLAAGMDDNLTKPVEMASLVQVLQRLAG